jgi:hypothetical protein
MAVKTITQETWDSLPSKKMQAKDREVQEYIDMMKAGKIIQVIPEGDGSVRGLKARLTRRAKSLNLKIEYRDMDRGFAARVS